MRAVELPDWLEPAGGFYLVRLGRDQDGGYLVDARDVVAADSLVSLGINDDWTFDQEFLTHRDVPLHAFDGAINRKMLAMKLTKAVATRTDVIHKFRAWRDYNKFFSGSRHHHAKMVGLNADGFVTLPDVLSNYVPSGRVFLKVDIEGWEYRILDDILDQSHRFTGLAIEFHDLDLNLEVVRSFVEKLPMSVAHIHCNSFAPVTDRGLPLAVEVTFSFHPPISPGPVVLPNRLDRESSPKHDRWKPTFVPVMCD